ncbi:MAG: energy-coupling factor transporter ATPase [Lachnospiraceae bacterium]|nr:energy-coupling factor transporter ATPase [Lachnospiraceae bacterium]
MIRTENVTFEYIRRDEEGNVEGITRALDDVSVHIRKGEFVAILGSNGSGKSTFARHMNALLVPEEGKVYVNGCDTSDDSLYLQVRQSCGMVFQNPDNQIIGQTVEEEVAFGPENMGIPTEEMEKRVTDALKRVGLEKERFNSPNRLSGGQKQRVAIAGILAMKPKCIVFDEPTAMLDPAGRKEVIATAHELNRTEGITIILITHYMNEAAGADRVIVMDKGRPVMDGTPRQVFAKADELRKYKLEVPAVTELGFRIGLGRVVLDDEEFAEAFREKYGK